MPSDLPYKKTADSQPGQVKEHDIESEFLQKLDGLKYTLRPDIRDRASMEQNFRDQFEALSPTRRDYCNSYSLHQGKSLDNCIKIMRSL